MSPAGRPLNSNTSLARNHANTVNTQQQGERRLRSNNSSSSSPLKPAPRRPSANATPTKSPGFKSSASNKHNDLPQRILAILESVPSTISVSAHPSNSLPTNFSSLTTRGSDERRHSHQEQSDEDFDPEEELSTSRRGSVNRFNSSGTNTSSSFKRPAHSLKRGLKKHGRRDSRQNSLTPAVPINGIVPSNQASSKMHSFRTRALDPLRQMPIRIIPHQSDAKKSENCSELEMLYNNKVLKRPLFNVSTGMEKEEEKEHHLRLAVEAQRAQTSGSAASSSHFIPIREVENVDSKEYKAYSNWKQIDKTDTYISYKKGKSDFFDEDLSYDADEEDVQFLQENNFFISLDQYENVIEKLEMASRDRVPSLHEFYQQHPEILLEHLERVYDFWISRRMKLIREHKISIPLIPYVPSKTKLGEKDGNNPYIAFRHRGPKVTTRRKQKLDTEHYSIMLRLAGAIQRTHILTKAMVERETMKLKMVETNVELFDEELGFLEQGGSFADLQTLYPTERQITTTVPYANKWLMKAWSEVAREIFNNKPLNREENILAIATRHGPEDGRFAFHRHPSCTYRTHHTSDPNHQESSASRSRALQAVKRKLTDTLLDDRYEKVPRQSDNPEIEPNVDLFDGYRTRFVGLNEDTWERLTGQRIPTFTRSRFARNGRLKLDFFTNKSSG